METNPDRMLLRRFLAGDGGPIAFDASPLAAALDGEVVAADAQAGALSLRFCPGAAFLQGASVLQGGALAAMLDFALAGAVMLRLRAQDSASTVSLTVGFLAAAPPGRYLAEAMVERAGRRIAFARATLRHLEADRLVATATAVMAVQAGDG
jgi:uncharacterized protein (TIGR00369 family)